MLVSLILGGSLLSHLPNSFWKYPRITIAAGSGHRGGGSSQESMGEKKFEVRNGYYCPSYYDYEDWGVFFLRVNEFNDKKVDWKNYTIIGSTTNGKKYHVVSISAGKANTGKANHLYCPVEKDVITLCYNDAAGNVYKTILTVNDPRVPCLFYRSNNKNRKELVELWLQLNKEKEKHEMIFDVENPDKYTEKKKK